MGGITFFLFIVEVVTGILLMFYYRPVAEYAYLDMKYLQFDVPFGIILRNIHRWGAHLMVVTVMLHMLRVFLTGSYKHPREFNWVVGVNLLVLTLLLSFTGYLLPWDQLAYWAITVGTNMINAAPLIGHEGPFSVVNKYNDIRFVLLGGTEIGANALLRFYVLHIMVLPLAGIIFIAVHFWRVRKDGGISRPL
jgi:quinol-cytochrome oxidoreductase complex cytochrome b subunit